MDLSNEMVNHLSSRHRWAATGVSDYPPRDPLVGQSRFFNRFKTFLHTVDHEDDHFAHVFAVEAEWGRGKSRLGHELVAQINASSKGWYVRDSSGNLTDKQLFDTTTQDKYLALYIRYSQVASEYQNSDNWFAFGLYQALLPIATGKFDKSIQSGIARQALDRLTPLGFESSKLAEAMELDQNHSEEDLYEDSHLLTRLVQAAHDYLKTFGIQYVMVVLDELETVAEAAAFGLDEDENNKRLDGQAIRLIGKAIKEEDPRKKVPWLRYVALCSPLLGQQLREIQSVDRRFELIELEHNAFADVSDYVQVLREDGKLTNDYPTGLVEAAYAMSGANFGWFNVVMANVDVILEDVSQQGSTPKDMGELFEAVLDGSGRVAKHVLDAGAVEGIQPPDQALLASCRRLLYGQLPVPLKDFPDSDALLALKNEDQEPVAARYRKLSLDRFSCRQALEQAKFRREKDEWIYPAVEQALSLDTLLDNLRTFSIQESDPDAILLPLSQGEFKYLLSLLYDHPAIEFAADALWQKLVGKIVQLPDREATHIGPSIAMLLRLNLRYRSVQRNSMIFSDLGYNDGHEKAIKTLIQQSSKKPQLRFIARLTGLMRLLDINWQYNQPALSNTAGSHGQALPIITEPRSTPGGGRGGGLLNLTAFKLHPDGKALFAWVNNKVELDQLHDFSGVYRQDNGRTPVLAFTASPDCMEHYTRTDESSTLRDDILLHYLNPSEVDQLERIGLDSEDWDGFSLTLDAFTTKFKNKLRALSEFVLKAIQQWRTRLNDRGLIAWPLKFGGKLSNIESQQLFAGWHLLAIKEPKLGGLFDIQDHHRVNPQELALLLSKLQVPGSLLTNGALANEHAGLFTELANPQQAQAALPLFLMRIANPGKDQQWSLDKARQEWYWGLITQSGVNAKTVFDDWMWWCGELNLLTLHSDLGSRKADWRSYPRSRLDNAITEANNWFTGVGGNGYPYIVKSLNRVFGYDSINNWFAPIGDSKEGTFSVEANEQLKDARKLYDTLKVAEESLPETLNDLAMDNLPHLIKQREDILALVEKVRPLNPATVTLGSVHTLKLDDRNESLYQRIEQARLFAEFVEKSHASISQRIKQLIDDLNEDCHSLDHFPKGFFSLSLQTVANILVGALEDDHSSATATKEGTASSDTLSHYLRSLKLDKASERLSLLANEAGINLDNESQQPFAEINGDILSTYRSAKEQYMKMLSRLEKLQAQYKQLESVLSPLPLDYSIQAHATTVKAQQQKLVLILDAFKDLGKDAEEKRQPLRDSMRIGRFSGIRDIPDQLFNPIRGQLHPIGGVLTVIQNEVRKYKQEKLAEVNDLLPSLRPLLQASGTSPLKSLDVDDFRDKSLSGVNITCDVTRQQWLELANKTLADTGLDFDQWQTICQSISRGENPDIENSVRDQLLEKGILQMRLTFPAD